METHVAWLVDWSSILANLSREELIEVLVLGRVWLFHLGHALLQVEALDEGNDVVDTGWVVVLLSHLLALLFQELDSAFPVQGFLLLGPIVQSMHADTHIDAHGLKGLLSGLAVNDIVAHVPGRFHCVEAVVREDAPEPFV